MKHSGDDNLEELYELMRIALAITKRGYIEDDYTKTIYLYIGEGTLSYDPYYNQLSYDDEEIEISQATFFIKEIKKRLAQVEAKITKSVVEAAFSKPLKIKLGDLK